MMVCHLVFVITDLRLGLNKIFAFRDVRQCLLVVMDFSGQAIGAISMG